MTVLLTLDNELPSDLDRLVALRSECFAGRGFHPRLRLIHRIEFGYAETLRCSADNGSSFSHEIARRLVDPRVEAHNRSVQARAVD